MYEVQSEKPPAHATKPALFLKWRRSLEPMRSAPHFMQTGYFSSFDRTPYIVNIEYSSLSLISPKAIIMAPQQPELDRTFVNLTDDPAEGRGARRTYIRRAVMKNFHKRRNQRKKALGCEAATASGILENASVAPITLINRRMGQQTRTLVSLHE